MNKISLKIYPDDVLRTICSEILNIDSNIIKIVQSMKEIMIKEKGIGLAGPQVGVTKRLFIAQDFSKDDELSFLTMINPKIKEESGEVSSKEGCLSIPGYYDYIPRFDNISVEYIDLNGDINSKVFEGIQSIVFQHELDHLDGILFPDRLAKIRKEIFFKKINKEFKK